ncbi:MAG: RluA family pseudouridine synthase [Planctomycetia bacterium]|nr:RluA family pseudouridine synthase [Planctomycetia bacterium]
MSVSPLQVLFEDNHCLALLKPAGVLTMGDATGDVSAVDLAREYLREKYDKPGKVFVGVVHRLDRPVSGVLLFARTSKAASRLSEQFRKHSICKIYHAVVEGRPPQRQGELVDWLAKSEASNISRVVKQDAENGSQEARLAYRCLKAAAGISLLEIDLQTGRSHQIRVQLSSRGMPICGDAKYGSQTRLDGWLALHAASLTFEHPTRHEPITVTAPHPNNWDRFRLGTPDGQRI